MAKELIERWSRPILGRSAAAGGGLAAEEQLRILEARQARQVRAALCSALLCCAAGLAVCQLAASRRRNVCCRRVPAGRQGTRQPSERRSERLRCYLLSWGAQARLVEEAAAQRAAGGEVGAPEGTAL